jgi:hypothetical protein
MVKQMSIIILKRLIGRQELRRALIWDMPVEGNLFSFDYQDLVPLIKMR